MNGKASTGIQAHKMALLLLALLVTLALLPPASARAQEGLDPADVQYGDPTGGVGSQVAGQEGSAALGADGLDGGSSGDDCVAPAGGDPDDSGSPDDPASGGSASGAGDPAAGDPCWGGVGEDGSSGVLGLSVLPETGGQTFFFAALAALALGSAGLSAYRHTARRR